MSAIEMYLKEAQTTKGTWHKMVISNLRNYMAETPEELIISAINKIQDPLLLPILWEVGLSQTLQDVSNKRGIRIAGSIKQGVTK